MTVFSDNRIFVKGFKEIEILEINSTNEFDSSPNKNIREATELYDLIKDETGDVWFANGKNTIKRIS